MGPDTAWRRILQARDHDWQHTPLLETTEDPWGLGIVGDGAQKEIGVMRSVGASNGAIVKIFWLEGIFLGIFGWIIASLIGYPLAQLFTQLLSDVLIPVEFYLPPSAVILLGVGMLLLVSLSSVIPALSAARSRVSDIIRYA